MRDSRRMEKWFERLSTLDSLFLELEDRTTHMHVGAVAVFEGKTPPYRDFLQLIEARLHQVPRYRQRVVFVPFRQGRPVWIDETQFDLEYHVRHTALPAPGGEEGLKRLPGGPRGGGGPDASRGPPLLAAPRGEQAALGDVARRGAEYRSGGAVRHHL